MMIGKKELALNVLLLTIHLYLAITSAIIVVINIACIVFHVLNIISIIDRDLRFKKMANLIREEMKEIMDKNGLGDGHERKEKPFEVEFL